MSKIIFFRHAQASFGADNYDALSSKGEQQSIQLGKYLVEKKLFFNKVFVGPLQRQQHTFEIVKRIFDKNNLPIPEPILINGLNEHVGYLALDKVLPKLRNISPYKEMIARIAAEPKRAKANRLLLFQYFMDEWVEGKIAIKGVVSWSNFRQNVSAGLKTILEMTESRAVNAVFTSGGTISAIVAESLKITDEKRVAALNFSIRNTAYTSFFYSKGQFNLLGLNEIPHLDEELITFV